LSFSSKLNKAKTYSDFYDLAVESERLASHLERKGEEKEIKIRERWSQALTAYAECVTLDPNNPKAWNGIGWILYKLKDMNKALINLGRALKADPKYTNAYINIGLVNRDLKKYDEALEAFEKARELSPHYDWAWYHAGLLHYISGNINQALEYLKRADALSSNLIIRNQLRMIEKAQRHIPPEPINKTLEKIEASSGGGKPDHCFYCGVEFSVEVQNNEKPYKHRLRQLVWETNHKLPQYAKTDWTKSKVKGLHTTTHVDMHGITTKGQRMGSYNIKNRGTDLTPLLQLEDFAPLPGGICGSCSKNILFEAERCLNKVSIKPIKSKIVESQENCVKCYVKVFQSWIGKRRP